jgi:hypothetical protein
MEDTQTRYELTEAERRHIAEAKAQMSEFESEILKYEGVIRTKERELIFMRRHLQLYLGVMASAARLPMGSQLSPDGAMLIAREA